jgi:hypothetical protein
MNNSSIRLNSQTVRSDTSQSLVQYKSELEQDKMNTLNNNDEVSEIIFKSGTNDSLVEFLKVEELTQKLQSAV